MRYVAFPSSFSRAPLVLESGPLFDDWSIIVGPTESGLYLLEATQNSIEYLKMIYDGLYIFMEDFI